MVFDAGEVARSASTAPTQSVALQNLSIRNSELMGLFSGDSSVGLDNVWVVDNANTGAHFTSSSFVISAGSRPTSGRTGRRDRDRTLAPESGARSSPR